MFSSETGGGGAEAKNSWERFIWKSGCLTEENEEKEKKKSLDLCICVNKYTASDNIGTTNSKTARIKTTGNQTIHSIICYY